MAGNIVRPIPLIHTLCIGTIYGYCLCYAIILWNELPTISHMYKQVLNHVHQYA